MALHSINPTTTDSWKDLSEHFSEIKDKRIQQILETNPSRMEKMRIDCMDVSLDFSKQRVTSQTMILLEQLANEVSLKDSIELLFGGSKINETEDRAVLHTALRDFSKMRPEVKRTLHQMKQFSDSIIDGTWKGYTGKAITDVVNIGIGGSDLGPQMVTESLQFYKNHLSTHFISNIDGDHVMESLSNLNRETTLFIIVSKTFTTQETLTNATTVREWFLKGATKGDIQKHFAAVSTNLQAVQDFGIAPDTIFPMWDWVGGRFSLWSAVGLSICCGIGYQNFEDLLKGAHGMDNHFRNARFSENIPVILALLSIWNTNFLKSQTEAVVPYSQYLSKLVPFLQQLVMESNGKSVDRSGNPINYQTSPIIWGSPGTNAQHAYFQLIHQGTKLIPVDFIVFTESLYGTKDAHRKLMANCYAQSEALLKGTFGTEVENAYKSFEGNKPSSTLLIKQLTPSSLGQLLAMYEHKTFVQGVIWNIYSFDQWGVELGKKIANTMLSSLED
jgi:glucose-6-phosphate isomerase